MEHYTWCTQIPLNARYKQNSNNLYRKIHTYVLLNQMMKETNLFAHVCQMRAFTETMKASIDVAAKWNETKQCDVYKEQKKKEDFITLGSVNLLSSLWFLWHELEKQSTVIHVNRSSLFFLSVYLLSYLHLSYLLSHILIVYYFIQFFFRKMTYLKNIYDWNIFRI